LAEAHTIVLVVAHEQAGQRDLSMPEVRQQIEGFAALHPRSSRDTPISGIVVTNGDLDHCLGLLCLREWQRFSVYATPRVRDGFSRSVFARTLARFDGQVTWRPFTLGREEPLLLSDGEPSGLSFSSKLVFYVNDGDAFDYSKVQSLVPAALKKSREMAIEVVSLFSGSQLHETQHFLFVSNIPPQQVAPYVASLDRMLRAVEEWEHRNR